MTPFRASTTTRCDQTWLDSFIYWQSGHCSRSNPNCRILSVTSETALPESGPQQVSPPRFHRAWSVAIVAFLALVGAASFRAAPSVLIDPLHEDFGWSRASISAAVSVNLILYGLTSPFAAALMERFGIRAVVTSALALISLGSESHDLHDLELAAHSVVGCLRRPRHRFDGAGVCRHRRRSLVRREAWSRDWHPDGRWCCRSAGVPARPGEARGNVRLEERRLHSFVCRAGRRAVRPAVPAQLSVRRGNDAGYGRARRLRPTRQACLPARRRRRPGDLGAGDGVEDQGVLASRRYLRDLRREHQRPDRNALRPGVARMAPKSRSRRPRPCWR